MKIEDIQKTVKYNELTIMNDHALRLIFSSLGPIKQQKMPCEKFYNLQRTDYKKRQ